MDVVLPVEQIELDRAVAELKDVEIDKLVFERGRLGLTRRLERENDDGINRQAVFLAEQRVVVIEAKGEILLMMGLGFNMDEEGRVEGFGSGFNNKISLIDFRGKNIAEKFFVESRE